MPKRTFSGAGLGAGFGWNQPTSQPGSMQRRRTGKAVGYITRSRALVLQPGSGRRGRGVAGFNPLAGGIRRTYRPQGIRRRTGGFTGIERKFYDSGLIASALTAPTDASGGEHDPSATVLLNTVTQGDGEEQRDGRKCTFQSVFVKGTVLSVSIANLTAASEPCKVYIALVLDTQTNGATIASENVFKNKIANANMAASPMRNMQFTQRFRILDTAEFTMPVPETTWDGTNMEMAGTVFPFELSSNLEFSSLFSGTTETVANITDNSLHVIAYCSSVELVPLIGYNARVRFVG